MCYNWYNDNSGNGGAGGEGGAISYQPGITIFAFNGDMITNNQYDIDYFEYAENGSYVLDSNGNEIKLEVLVKKTFNGTSIIDLTDEDGEPVKFIPSKIFVQDGISRAVYRGNFETATSPFDLENQLNKAEQREITHYQQGIGSGAGYLEVSNGTFEPIGE